MLGAAVILLAKYAALYCYRLGAAFEVDEAAAGGPAVRGPAAGGPAARGHAARGPAAIGPATG